MNAEEAYKLYQNSQAAQKVNEGIREAATKGHVSTVFPRVQVSNSIRRELKILGFLVTEEDWVIEVCWDLDLIAEEERQRKFREAQRDIDASKRKIGGDSHA